jgi:hypothetical protein
MKTLEIGARIAAVVLVLFDTTLAAQMYFHGWPTVATWTTTDQGLRAVKMTKAPLTFADWSVVFGFVLLHLFVIYMVWLFTHGRKGNISHQS